MPVPIRIDTAPTRPFILLPTQVNGHGPFRFVLDTGASMTIVTESVAVTAGIEATETRGGLGSAGRTIAVTLGEADSMSVEDAAVENVRVGILKTLPKCVGADGALGYNFLKGFLLTIDYGRDEVTFSSPAGDSGRAHPDQTGIILRITRPDRPIPVVDAVVNGQRSWRFILDTGASNTVVSPDVVHGTRSVATAADSLIGAGGATPASTAVLESVSLGEAAVTGLTAVVADIFSPLGQAVGTRLDGILGFDFLSRFTVGLDYPNGRLHLARRAPGE